MDYNLQTPEYRDKLLKEAADIRIDRIALNSMVIEQIEHTRKSLGLPQTYFAELLGTSKDFYNKLVKNPPERYVHIDTLVNYCQIFGLDISGIIQESTLKSTDSALREIAMILSCFSRETILALADTIKESNERDCIKDQAIDVLNHLAETTKRQDNQNDIVQNESPCTESNNSSSISSDI